MFKKVLFLKPINANFKHFQPEVNIAEYLMKPLYGRGRLVCKNMATVLLVHDNFYSKLNIWHVPIWLLYLTKYAFFAQKICLNFLDWHELVDPNKIVNQMRKIFAVLTLKFCTNTWNFFFPPRHPIHVNYKW